MKFRNDISITTLHNWYSHQTQTYKHWTTMTTLTSTSSQKLFKTHVNDWFFKRPNCIQMELNHWKIYFNKKLWLIENFMIVRFEKMVFETKKIFGWTTKYGNLVVGSLNGLLAEPFVVGSLKGLLADTKQIIGWTTKYRNLGSWIWTIGIIGFDQHCVWN